MNCPYDGWIMSFDGEVHSCENCGYSQGDENDRRKKNRTTAKS